MAIGPNIQAVLDSSCVDRSSKGDVINFAPLAIVGAAAAVNIYDKDAGDQPLQLLRIQNVSNAGVVNVMVNDVATVKVYNAILAADTGVGNGLGGVLTLTMDGNIKKVSVFSQAGTVIAVLKITNPSNTRV